jgi:hypothetical protein
VVTTRKLGRSVLGLVRKFLYHASNWPIFVSISIFKLQQFWFWLLLRPRWLIKPIASTTTSNPDSSDLVKFAFSSLDHWDSRYSVTRLKTRSKDSILIDGVLLSVSSSVTGLCDSFWFADAEDPRLILYNEKVYVYIQKAKIIQGKVLDCDIFLVDACTGKFHKLVAPFSYNGKNWIAYENKSSLFFLYSLQPLVILKVPTNELAGDEILMTQISGPKVPDLKWGDDFGFIGEVRGGTPLREIDSNQYLGFTHITPKGSRKSEHYMGVFIYDALLKTARHLPLTSQLRGRLFDPYGIDIVDDFVHVFYSSSVNIPEKDKMPVSSKTVTFSKSILISAIKENGVDISDV